MKGKVGKQLGMAGWVMVLMIFLGGGLLADVSGQQKSVKKLAPLAFHEALSQHPNALIIDTRPDYKFEDYRLKDAVLAVSQEELLKVVKDQPKDRPLFVYCEIGDRSKRAVKVLAEQGFTTVFELKGGLAVWMEEGLEVDTMSLKEY